LSLVLPLMVKIMLLRASSCFWRYLMKNLLTYAAILLAGGLATANMVSAAVTHVAIYRGGAGCPGCSEMVRKSLEQSGLPLDIAYVGEQEKIKVTEDNLATFDVYIQPGGGQDIPGAFAALGDEGAEAIRKFVRNGKSFLGLCMGAYLADENWLGLIPSSLDSEVMRKGTNIPDEGDYVVDVVWQGKTEKFYYQDGPYLNAEDAHGFVALARYANGDIALAKYTYGKGTVLLSGPHPEADESWMAPEKNNPAYTSAGSKMARLFNDLKPGR
jgi:glutamine amidotransferase-like uncharacterized protein